MHAQRALAADELAPATATTDPLARRPAQSRRKPAPMMMTS
jgi:hypothetical protein